MRLGGSQGSVAPRDVGSLRGVRHRGNRGCSTGSASTCRLSGRAPSERSGSRVSRREIGAGLKTLAAEVPGNRKGDPGQYHPQHPRSPAKAQHLVRPT
jgi:hypothetical protein